MTLYGWTLKALLRGTEKDLADVIHTMLTPIDAEYLLRQRRLPVPILAKLRQACQQLASQGQLTVAEEMALDRNIEELNDALLICQRITASPIPPLYTSHTSRLLMFYLGCLPLALHQSMNGFVTLLTSFVVGYAMLGLDEISHLLENPFRLMPLLQLSKASMLDVADALVCQPASLNDSLSQLGVLVDYNNSYLPPTPAYW